MCGSCGIFTIDGTTTRLRSARSVVGSSIRSCSRPFGQCNGLGCGYVGRIDNWCFSGSRYEPHHRPSAIRPHGLSQREGVSSKPRNTTRRQGTITRLAENLVSLGRLAIEVRSAKRYSILLAMMLLQGCVLSRMPLLDDKTAIIDPLLTGHYRLSGLDKLPSELDIYIKENRYVLVASPKDIFIATFHPLQDGVYIAQLRKLGANSRYIYFLIRKSDSGLELNFIPCDASCDPIDNLESLNTMATNAVSHFDEKEFAKAEKISELGR